MKTLTDVQSTNRVNIELHDDNGRPNSHLGHGPRTSRAISLHIGKGEFQINKASFVKCCFLNNVLSRNRNEYNQTSRDI